MATEKGSSELSSRALRKVYLITCSQADISKFPTREQFGEAVAEAFSFGESVVKPKYLVCSKEPHEEGGFHYHVAIKLSGNKC